MWCAQRGCELTADQLADLGVVPVLCPTCGNPLQFVLTRDEAAEVLGLPLEEDATKTERLPLEDDERGGRTLSEKIRDEGLDVEE